jgi:hypothetical protein
MRYAKRYDPEETPEGILIYDMDRGRYINEDEPVKDIKDAEKFIVDYEVGEAESRFESAFENQD